MNRLAFIFMVNLFGNLLAADWPQHRGDAARSGYTAEAVPNRLELAWVHRARHAPRPAWPTPRP